MTDPRSQSRTNERTHVARVLHSVQIQRIFGNRLHRALGKGARNFNHDARTVFDGTYGVVEFVGHNKKSGAGDIGYAFGQFDSLGMNVVFPHDDGARFGALFTDHFGQMNALGQSRTDLSGSSRMLGDFAPALDVFIGCGVDDRHEYAVCRKTGTARIVSSCGPVLRSLQKITASS